MAHHLAYLPLYVRDFWTDPKVLAMAWLEQAVYLRMLMLSWEAGPLDRKSTRLNSSHIQKSRMPSSA